MRVKSPRLKFAFPEGVWKGLCDICLKSTGVCRVPIFTVSEDKIEVIVGNAYKIKHIPGRKTDRRDSEWIQNYAFKGMIEPSRIFPKKDRGLNTHKSRGKSCEQYYPVEEQNSSSI